MSGVFVEILLDNYYDSWDVLTVRTRQQHVRLAQNPLSLEKEWIPPADLKILVCGFSKRLTPLLSEPSVASGEVLEENVPRAKMGCFLVSK